MKPFLFDFMGVNAEHAHSKIDADINFRPGIMEESWRVHISTMIRILVNGRKYFIEPHCFVSTIGKGAIIFSFDFSWQTIILNLFSPGCNKSCISRRAQLVPPPELPTSVP